MALKENEIIYYYSVKVVNPDGEAISGATVTFVVYGKNHIETTGSNGRATYTYRLLEQSQPEIEEPNQIHQEELIDIEICICGVKATGYVEIEANPDTGVGVDASITPNIYTTIEMTPIEEETHYYNICVSDSSSLKFLKDAKVDIRRFKNSLYTDPDAEDRGTRMTDKFGNCMFLYTTNGGERFINVSKNGYNTITGKSVMSSTSQSDVITVELVPTPQAQYYYVILVKDGSGKGVNGVKVRLYKDSSKTTPYSLNTVRLQNADDEIFYTVCKIISNVVGISSSKINLTDRFGQDLGIDDDESQIIREVDNVFSTQTSSLDDFITIGEFVNYIKETSDLVSLPQTIYTTNSAGFIQITIGEGSSSQPNPIYGELISLPVDAETGKSKYIFTTNQGNKYTIPSTLSNTTPGWTMTLSSYVGSTYFYNFKIVDEQTWQPIYGANITYMNNDDEVLQTKVSPTNGIVKYSSKYERLYLTISKPGYAQYEKVGFSGSSSNEGIYDIYLSQNHTVQVIDHEGLPAEGIEVTVFVKDANGNKIYRNKYKTYETGYIDNLGDDIYTESMTTNIYVGVLDYDPANEKSLIKNLSASIVTRTIVIKLTEAPEIVDYVSEFDEFNDVSVNSIKNNIASGKGNKVTYNSDDFRISIVDPDSIDTYDILTCVPVVINSNQKSVIGSVNIDMKDDINDLHIKTLNRYSGYYNPIFKDILFYNDFSVVDDKYKTTDCPFSNTEFDYNYEDNYGKFGVIDNMWFHKVNDDKDNKIFKTLKPYYPLTGQYALDKRKYNIFESNWDVSYHTRQTGINTSEKCSNIVSMKDGICMFGSKYLNVPNVIEICGFTLGDGDYDGTWNDDWIANPDGCPGEVMFKEVNDNSVDFYFFIKKRILRYFREMLREEFEENINFYNSYGKHGVDDDIDEYVSKNVLKLYKLEKVRIFIRRRKKGQHNSKIENEYFKYLQYIPDPNTGEDVELTKDNLGYFKSHGFVEVKNATMTKLSNDSFDRKLVYNLRNGTKEDFGFSFVLRKI